MKLSIIIVNYNVKFFLEQCLYSVLHAIKDMDAEVVVVDNNSTDGSLAYLQPAFPFVRFIVNGKNLGFGKANNLAMKQATGEYILFLNPDTIVPEDCFVKCITFLDTHEKCGALGVRMLDGSGTFLPESKRSFPSATTAVFKAAGLAEAFRSSRILNRYSLGYLDENSNHLVDVLAGAFMMVRKKVIEQVGGFDEQFFMYGEDIDLSYRIRKAGFDNWYFAGTSIIHFKGESLKKWSANHVKVFYEAMIVFVKKHYQGRGAALLKVLLILGIRVKSFLSLAKGAVGLVKKPQQKATTQLIVLGSDKSVAACAAVYKIYQPDTSSFTSIDPADEKMNEILDELSQTQEAKELIFCLPDIRYTAAIAIINKYQSKFLYRFHAVSSNAIVGSDVKSQLGEVLSLN